LPEPKEAYEFETADAPKLTAYNHAIITLFLERDTHAVDSPERTEVAERILAVWIAEGD
jgi:hypothetical protein